MMNEKLKILGITGGIGTGKSEAGRILRKLGGLVIDSDDVARMIVEPGTPAHAKIVEQFGTEILDAGNNIDRKKLGAIVFNDKSLRLLLNEITHKSILEEIKNMIYALFPDS